MITKPNAPEVDYTQMGASYGLAPILTQLATWSRRRSRPVWDICLVNIQTFIRNCQRKGASIPELVEAVYRDIQLFQQYFGQYHNTGLNPIRPKIIYFLPFYHPPVSYVRELSPSLQEQQAVAKIIAKNWSNETRAQEDSTIVTCTVGSTLQLPHLAVLDNLAKVEVRYRHLRTCLVSNIVLDFHLASHLLHFHLLESFTGQLKTKEQLGPKVFKHEQMPFFPLTHVLLGDGQYIKRGLEGRKSMQLLKELAFSKKWQYSSETTIRRDLVGKGIIPQSFTVKLVV